MGDTTQEWHGPTLFDASDSFEHEVGAEPFKSDVRLDRQRHSRITTYVSKFEVIREMASDDFIPVPTDVDARHLGRPVRVDRDQMNQTPRINGRPGGLVKSYGSFRHSFPPVTPREAYKKEPR
jgi:hypothetical protein